MAKFLSRLFSAGSSSKRSSLHGSHPSLNEDHNNTSGGPQIRTAASLENISSYHVNPKELEKNKLHKASWEGNLNKVQRLIRPGHIDAKDQQSRTPLHLAVARGHVQIVQKLVHEGAKLNIVDKEERTPLLKAVVCSTLNPELYRQICFVLLQGGADSFMNSIDVHRKNALHYAIEFGNYNLTELLLSCQRCDVNYADGDYMTPLHLAVKRNSPDIVALILATREGDYPADPNIANRNGQTPLHMAAGMGSSEILKHLLRLDILIPCDPTIVDANQFTALQLAKENKKSICVDLITKYQQIWAKHSPRSALESIYEQEINPTTVNPTARPDDDITSSSSNDTGQLSRSSSKPIQPPNIWLNRGSAVLQENPQKPHSIAELMKSNPLQPNLPKTQGTSADKPSVTSLLHNANPLIPNENSFKKPTTTAQEQHTVLSHIVGKQRHSLSSSSDSDSDEGGLSPRRNNESNEAGLLPKKNVTIANVASANLYSGSQYSNPNSWSYDKSSSNQPGHIVSAPRRTSHSDDTSETASDEDDNHNYKGVLGSNFQTKHIPEPTSGFVIPQATEKYQKSESDEDSIEEAIRGQSPRKPSLGIQNLVNPQIGASYKMPQSTSISTVQPPISEDYILTASSTQSNKEFQSKGIDALIKQQPLLVNRKPNEPMRDDSRPLSADLQPSHIKPQVTDLNSSSDSETDQEMKPTTIVRSPLTDGVLSGLVVQNIQRIDASETKATGVENLAKIFENIARPKPTNQNQQTTPTTINKNNPSNMLPRSHSLSSSDSSIMESTIRGPKISNLIGTSSKPQLYNDEAHWSTTINDRHDYNIIQDKYTSEMIQTPQRQIGLPSVRHDFNSLRGSMSSSTSSHQNNMDRFSELKEDIKQIERKQEDSFELKRQLKDMEIKKNNYEALYKRNDQLLRETETKLEKEINEKQRLEWATKALNNDLKIVKQKLEALEEEKEILNQRCAKLLEERDNYDKKLLMHQANSLQSTAAGVLREEDIEKIKARHREEMKLLSAENEDLHQRTKQLQSDLQLHRESLDVTIRYKIDLEKALEEKTVLQLELDRLKHEKEIVEKEKADYKTKYDALQEEIRVMLLDRSKLEQKLTNELQEQMKQRQRSTDDVKKYKVQIEQLNLKLGDAEARLLVLQTQNEVLLASKDRELKNEFETLTQRLNHIESEKQNAEQRFHNDQKDITNKHHHQQQQQQPALHEPLSILASTPLNNALQQQQQHYHHQHSPSASCRKCDTLQRSYEQEREQRLFTEKENDRLRDFVSRQKQSHELNKSLQQQQEYEQLIAENSKQIRSETERVKHELDRLRHDFDQLVSNYDPSNNLQQQAKLHSQIDSLRQFYEQQFRQQLLSSKLNNETAPAPAMHHYHPPAYPRKLDDYDHSLNGSANCSVCTNSRLLKERLESAIDTSLADQRIQAIKQMPILPRLTTPLAPSHSNPIPSFELMRKRYYV